MTQSLESARPPVRTRSWGAPFALGVAAAALTVAVVVAASTGVAAGGAQAAAKKSIRDAVFSAAQAERGQATFDERCAACHSPVEFTGPVFLTSWSGQPVNALLDFVRTSMPEDNPGSLKPQEYVDVLTYFFKENGLPTGKTDLKADPATLKAVIIEEPAK